MFFGVKRPVFHPQVPFISSGEVINPSGPFGCDSGWRANNGKGCEEYARNKYCKKDGDHYGSGWLPRFGKFKDFADGEGRTALVCPQCGCGRHDFLKV